MFCIIKLILISHKDKTGWLFQHLLAVVNYQPGYNLLHSTAIVLMVFVVCLNRQHYCNQHIIIIITYFFCGVRMFVQLHCLQWDGREDQKERDHVAPQKFRLSHHGGRRH